VNTNETIALPTPIPSQNMEENKSQQASIAASYTPTVIPYYFDLYTMGRDYMCTGKEECTVWYYTDGKVHLYRRIIELTNGNADIQYGSIVNTDGSVSCTTGDNVNKFFLLGDREYHYIDFIVTNSYYDFSTYWK
jgi:hypothetical protein